MPKVVEIRSTKGYTVEIQSLQVIVAVIMIVMIERLNDMTCRVGDSVESALSALAVISLWLTMALSGCL